MNFTLLFLISTILLSSFFNTGINAQNDISQPTLFNNIYSAAELEYGIDQELVNGVLFENFYLPIVGHPYFLVDTFLNGGMVYRGKQYSDLLLKYDLYDQQLLVNYVLNDFQIIFYLPTEFISEFNIENKKFVKHSFPGEETDRFYQIVGKDYPVKILYLFEKIRTKTYKYFSPSYEFSVVMKSSFLLINSNLVGYNRNGSFVSKFPKQDHKLIKTFIRKNKISVKNSSDNEIYSLIKYCNSLTFPH